MNKIRSHRKLCLALGILLGWAAQAATAETLTIPVTKDGGYDWRGWFSTSYGYVYAASTAKAYFYADVMSRITAPGMATTIYSATFHYQCDHVFETYPPYTIQAFRVADDWNEDTGPAPACGEGYGTYTGSQVTGWFSLDVKNLVQAWADSTYPNYGLMLTDTVSDVSQAIASREGVEQNQPYFVIEYALNPIREVNIPVTRDSGLSWQGWVSQSNGFIYAADTAKAHFYADILAWITAPGRTTRLHSATFNYRVVGSWGTSLPYTIQAFRIADDWQEDGAQQGNARPGYAEGYDFYTGSQLTGDFSLNIKNLVQAWLAGTYPNYGIMLTDTLNYAVQGIATRENTDEDSRPYFKIRYSFVPQPWESEVSDGHRILIQKGFQIQGLTFPGQFSLPRFTESNFTTINCWECEYPVDQIGPPPGPPWGRWTPQDTLTELTANEMPYLQSMVSLQYYDELDLTDPATIPTVRDWVAQSRQLYPDVISYTNLRGTDSYEQMKAFVSGAQPDMIMSGWYVYDPAIPTNPGGSPITLYEKLQIFRQVGLGGWDGTGARPIPYAAYTQTWIISGRQPSESEFRLNDFIAWAMGYKYICAFLYSTADPMVTILFNGLDDSSPTPAFYQMAELNRQGRNLGPALVRLLSTDVRFIPGLHQDGSNNVANLMPGSSGYSNSRIYGWSDADAPTRPASTLLTSISNVTNLGGSTINNGLKGDVLVGFFKPLHESFDGPDYSDQVYFMVVNGLSDTNGTATQTRQRIRLNFAGGVMNIQRMRRDNGVVETLSTTANGSSRYYEFELDGGTGDLFKFDTGAPFVGCTMNIPGDANNDGKVDVGDLGILAANYGTTVGATWDKGDFNGDGKVDVSDLGILAANYGTGSGASLDFNKDAAALGLAVTDNEAKAQEDQTPVTSALGCGAAGLPLVAGLLLAGLMLPGFKVKE